MKGKGDRKDTLSQIPRILLAAGVTITLCFCQLSEALHATSSQEPWSLIASGAMLRSYTATS